MSKLFLARITFKIGRKIVYTCLFEYPNACTYVNIGIGITYE